MKALIVGTGKMGKAVEEALLLRGHSVAGRLGRGDALTGDLAREAQVAFEFTTGDAAPARVTELLEAGIPVVSGTTGWNVAPAWDLARQRKVGFLHAPNFSIGVAGLKRAVAALAEALAPYEEFEPAIVERHHAAKKDAPSGTARLLAAALKGGRQGGAHVPVVSVRHGGQPGEHVVVFEGPEESVELVHRARSRGIFAAGAVQAAEWLVGTFRRGPVGFDDFFERRGE